MNSTATKLIPRRAFLKRTAVTTAGVVALSSGATLRAANAAQNKIVVAVIGCNARGMNHIRGLLGVPNVEVGFVCDVDKRAVEKGIAAAAKLQARPPKAVSDLRRLFDNPEVDAVSIATPDHWHAPATIMACAAGKHVYVEKPGSHNLRESELIVTAARKHKRVVQMGNQRRSWPWVQEAMQALQAGEIGAVRFARGWYANNRASIGRGKIAAVPDWLDYSLWQGPAPERPFRDNLIHYNWHWFWHWGTGEMGNNAVHALDLARWGLQVELPTRVTCGGNRYFHQDDWETPDTTVATFDFGDRGMAWEGHSCAPRGFEGASFGVNFYGAKGSLSIAGNNATIYDLKNKVGREIKSDRLDTYGYDVVHFQNFADAIRSGTPLAAEIAEGQKSTVLCHLGNIAWRTGRTIDFDPQNRKILSAPGTEEFVGREYRAGWEPQV